MILQERIQKIVEYSGLSIPKFANHVGFKTPQAIRELIRGNTKTLSDAAQYKITSAYPEVNPEWLLTGEGDMLIPGAVSAPSGCTAPPTDLGKALDEIAAQRRLLEKSQEQIDRLISIIERMNERK